ncbi:MAG: UrcA family protein [Phenylobacterium sp.]
MRPVVLAAAAVAALAFSAPALAQTVDELTVTGRALRAPQSLSERVSYADLDLNQARDRKVLLQRVNAAAGRVCDQLDEPRPHAGNLGRSCQELAVRAATDQVRLAFADARWAPAFGANSYPANSYAAEASAVARDYVVTAGPVPDTPENRARYGGPMSRAGKRTMARGN